MVAGVAVGLATVLLFNPEEGVQVYSGFDTVSSHIENRMLGRKVVLEPVACAQDAIVVEV